MPILPHESELDSDDFAALSGARANAGYKVIAHRRDPDFEVVIDSTSESWLWSSTLYDGEVVHCPSLGSPPQHYNTNTQEWPYWDAFYTGYDYSEFGYFDFNVNSVLVVDGDNLYQIAVSDLYQEGGARTEKYIRSTFWNGTTWSTWTSEWNLATPLDIKWIGAAHHDRVHAIVDSGNDRNELVCIYSDGTVIRQDLHWPFPVESISVAALGDKDVIAITSMLPAVIRTRTINTSIVKEAIPTGGISVFIFNGKEYSDHIEVERVHEWQPWRYRKGVKITEINGTLHIVCSSADGTKLNQFKGYRHYTSKDAVNWSRGAFLPFPYNTPNTGGVSLLHDGEYVYVSSGYGIYKSPSTWDFGYSHPDMQVDITPHILRYTAQQSGIYQVGLELNDQNGLWNNTLLDGNHQVILQHFDGYHPTPETPLLLQQVAVTEVDSFVRRQSTTEDQYTEVLSLTARDRLGWLLDRTQSEEFQFRDPQVIGDDDYHDDTDTGYGGMAHTATWEGSWRTIADTLEVHSNNKEALAASTHKIDLWNFQSEVRFHLAENSGTEYAGFIFHGQDHKNHFRCYYDQGTDRIRVERRANDIDTTMATSPSTLGWASSPTTWRWLRLAAYYGLLYVYLSDDGITWNEHMTVVLPGQAALPSTEGGALPDYIPQQGFLGLMGQGYAPEFTWEFEFLISEITWLWEFPPDFSLPMPENYFDDEMEDPSIERVYGGRLYMQFNDKHYRSLNANNPGTGGIVWTEIDGPIPNDYVAGAHVAIQNNAVGVRWLVSGRDVYYCNVWVDTEYHYFTTITLDTEDDEILTMAEAMNYKRSRYSLHGGMIVEQGEAGLRFAISYGAVIICSDDNGDTWYASRVDNNLFQSPMQPFHYSSSGSDHPFRAGCALATGYNFSAQHRLWAFFIGERRYWTGGTGAQFGIHSYLFYSDDWGRTWQLKKDISYSSYAGSNLFISNATPRLFVPRRKAGGYRNEPVMGEEEIWIIAPHLYSIDPVGMAGGLHKSTDSGATFSQIEMPNEYCQWPHFASIAFSQLDSDNLMLTVVEAHPTDGSWERAWASNNGGQTWSPRYTFSYYWNSEGIIICHPHQHLVAMRLHKSSPGPGTWARMQFKRTAAGAFSNFNGPPGANVGSDGAPVFRWVDIGHPDELV